MTPRLDDSPGPSGPETEDRVGRLIELAGARPPVPAERAERVRSQAREGWQAGVRRRRRARGVALGAAAATATLVVALPALRDRGGGDRPTVRIEASHGPVRWSGEALETGDGGRAAIRMDDGTAFRLDVGTRLRFRSNRVVVLETGAAYVIADARGSGGLSSGPVLRTPFGDIHDIGTRFEVRLEGGSIRVRVREGRVRVGEGSEAVDAAVGDEIRIGPDGLLDRRAVALHGPEWAWTLSVAPAFDLEGRTLADLLAWVAEETGWRVAFADPELARRAERIVLHGSLENVPADQALSIVAPTAGISFRAADGVLEVGP